MACKKQCGGRSPKKQSGGVVRTTGGMGPMINSGKKKGGKRK